jgi:Tfp pilus assembly protein PilN
MKKINIITSLSPQKQYEIYRWFWITVVASLCMVIIGTYFIGTALCSYNAIQKDLTAITKKTNNYVADLGTNASLKKEYDELRLKENKINAHKMHKKNPYLHIAEIVSLCRDGVQLESLKSEKEDIEIVIIASFSDRIQTMIKQLSASPNFSHVKMISLQHNEQNKELRCMIKGEIIF